MEEKRTYLDDISEEESRAMDNDPEFQASFQKITEEAKRRQAALRKKWEEAERNSTPSGKET